LSATKLNGIGGLGWQEGAQCLHHRIGNRPEAPEWEGHAEGTTSVSSLWHGTSSHVFPRDATSGTKFCNSLNFNDTECQFLHCPFRLTTGLFLLFSGPEKAGVDSSILSLGTTLPRTYTLPLFFQLPTNCPRLPAAGQSAHLLPVATLIAHCLQVSSVSSKTMGFPEPDKKSVHYEDRMESRD
jgi:hypothetical protein